ncbi:MULTISPECIES: ATP-binding cassette domain-containing protein [unclassified Mesorhizobium]|uniref:iron ABC transporter ATP-binding protein n=1 Tax=unclassified Mesorhizobium TaxID=325217 RepID=UPI000FD2F219|nr:MULTISPECIES: ATP-binding cassette domain-containing protein [unclassified Mesorhizobium]RUV12453.1 ATP-binding cassette domain-containing protein [Mesorhizobium sp. M5C.F.Ca.IN.020.32.2.1]RWC46453.1 MAG: ATP-binding cassette domain-containing protein [Mesorhizobium sp.]RWE82400.1 MAG: ATP-binding cassette domain-containing protein [Mesorhizobium sp.]RWF04597.1 MAG: ATP-binding cassette domain-containing protein [Mesorhizobium sp.]RWF76598.1 MAG: ATP-binding cassette domain-containing prote
MIEIAGVSLALGGSRILDNVSLTVPKGGVTALVGPNGAGKSSLLSLIARLQPLQSGRITVDGLPVDTTPSRQLAKIMAILRQDPGVAGRLRVVELVGFGRFPHHRGRLTAGDREIIAASLEQFDLSDLALRFIDTLSGGQRQRALVAMTFCQGTDYILLDEPLNNLDMFHARNLMRTLRRIADEHGKTVLIVLHDINHAASYADRVVAMKDGAVVAMGETGDVIRPDILESIFGFSMRVENIAGRLTVLHHA